MAKKKQSKKHKFKYADPVTATVGGASTDVPRSGDLRAPQVKATTGSQRDFSYVGSDMRRILVLAGSLVAVELLLYYLLGHTGLGAAINRVL